MAPLKLTLYQLGRKVRAQLKVENAPCTLRSFVPGLSFPTFARRRWYLNGHASVGSTPTEAEPQFLCIPRDSCVGPQFRGLDPITNFMDYVDDVCMEEFTSDQSKRMRKQWHAFRDKKARN